jgi:acetylornithine deacetylase/succinyl-diaminopimelate desuccinylase-like protein
MLSRVLGEDVSLTVDLGGAECRVRADSAQVQQVIMNLALNARDAMPHGGKITISIDAVTAADPWLCEQPPRIEWLEGTHPAGIAAEHPLFQVVSQAIAAVTGQAPEPYAGHSASDIRIPITYAGIPAVGYGPRCTQIAAAGAADESIEIAEFLDTVTATALVLANWCGVEDF